MHAKLFRVLVGGLMGVGLVGSASSASAQNVDIYPLSKVKRGQKGYGLTTMKGTSPERFEFEVIGVQKNFLPKMDIILVKSDDPKVQVTGFWQGMSGSPLYIEGKLTCAFSYGFRFNKLAIGGCTPLHYMKKEGFQARRGNAKATSRNGAKQASLGKAPTTAASLADWLALVPDGDVGKSLSRHQERKLPWLLSKSMPKRSQLVDDDRGMRPAAVPLALSGFSAPAFAQAKELMKDFPLEPMQAGGTGSADEGPKEFQMGGSISVQLVRGDMSAAATGTVSYVNGDGVLAFGHPMFHAGELYAPVASAEVHTVIPSAQSAFVVASPMRELGALTQDRQSTIAADTSLKVKMIPVHIRIVDDKGKAIGDFNVEVLDNRFFTSTFASIAASNATSLYLPDRDHATVKMKSRVELKGQKPIEFVDYLYSSRGASGLVGSARGLRVLSPLLNNPFGTVEIESVDLEVEVAYATNYADIGGLKLPKRELIPGERNYVDVTLEPFQGEPFVQRVPFDVPRNLAGGIVRLEVVAGDSASLYIAPPKTIDDLVKAFRSMLPGTVYAVTLYSAEDGAAIDGKLIKDIPASAMNRLRNTTKTPAVTTRKAQSRSTFPAKRVLEGSDSILVKVAPLK